MATNIRPSAYGARGPLIVKFVWSLVGVYTVLLALRTYVRVKLVHDGGLLSLGLAYLAYFWGIAAAAICTHQMLQGVGNHYDIVLAAGTNPTELNKWQWIYHAVNSTDFPIARASVLAFILDIMGRSHKLEQRILIGMVSFSFILSWVVVSVLFTQCSPSRKLWDKDIPGSCPAVRSRVNLAMAMTSGSYGALTDLTLSIFPIYLVHRLHMALRVKILVSTLMGLGIFSAIASIFRTVNLKIIPATAARNKDFTYDEAPLYFWASAELWTILIAGSLPTVWPLIKKVLRLGNAKKLAGSKKNTSAASREAWDGRGSVGDGSELQLHKQRSAAEAEEIEMRKYISVEHERRVFGEDDENDVEIEHLGLGPIWRSQHTP